MIRVSYFSDDSFVLHKVVINKKSYSAWFLANGTPYDAEVPFTNRYHNLKKRSVPKTHTKIWAALAEIGKRYVKKKP